MDQDPHTIDECSRRYLGSPINPVRGSVRQLLSGSVISGQFDFVYAAGLFDYLNDSIARALLQKMFALLKPGGTLLFANFARGLVDSGYMEAFMDWWLIYRTEKEMRSLLAQSASGDLNNIRVFRDPWNAIVYAVAEKA
jgi:SAM-dependent methyltransferase